MQLLSSPDDNWWTVDYCDVFIRLSFWRHPFTSITETLRHISPNLMKKQTHLHLGWSESECDCIFWLNYSFKKDCLSIVLLTRAADKRGVQFSGQQRIRHVSQKLFEQRRHVMNTVPLVQNNIGTLIEGFTELNVTTNTRQHWELTTHTSYTNEVQLFRISTNHSLKITLLGYHWVCQETTGG